MVRNLDLHDSNRRFRNDGLVGETGRVKKLDLFESNHGCGLNVPSQGRDRNGRNITLQGPELVRNVFQKPLGAAGSSPVVSVGSSILNTREGRLDIVVNNAGIAIAGPLEFTSTEEAHRQIDVNLFGALRVCRAVLPIMRRRRWIHRQYWLHRRPDLHPVPAVV
jgi:short chain dehydrogenase